MTNRDRQTFGMMLLLVVPGGVRMERWFGQGACDLGWPCPVANGKTDCSDRASVNIGRDNTSSSDSRGGNLLRISLPSIFKLDSLAPFVRPGKSEEPRNDKTERSAFCRGR
nr:hypothetical protein [uncultured Cohaesibacter sp.]